MLTTASNPTLSPYSKKKLTHLCEQYRDLQEQVAALDEAKKITMADIRSIAEEYGLESFKGDKWVLAKRVRSNSKISPEKLLKRGVKMEVIEFATEITVSEFFTVIATKK